MELSRASKRSPKQFAKLAFTRLQFQKLVPFSRGVPRFLVALQQMTIVKVAPVLSLLETQCYWRLNSQKRDYPKSRLQDVMNSLVLCCTAPLSTRDTNVTILEIAFFNRPSPSKFSTGTF